MNEVDLRSFVATSDPNLFEAYRRIKYEIFVVEGGWESLRDEGGGAITRVDPFDVHSTFWLALTRDGRPIGVLRGTPLKLGFPHREFFEHHLERAELKAAYDQIFTMNALAVLPEYRKARFDAPELAWRGTVARMLLMAMVNTMRTSGMLGALVTTGSIQSTKVLQYIGFQVIDPPKQTSIHEELMTNLGIVLGTPKHLKAEEEICRGTHSHSELGEVALDLWRYFRQRQEWSFSQTSSNEYFETAE